MSHVYRAEIIADGVVNLGHTPGDVGPGDYRGVITHHKYYLLVSDTIIPPGSIGRFWAIEAAVTSHVYGAGINEFRAEFRPRWWDGVVNISTNSDPETWLQVFDHDGFGGYISIQNVAADGGNGATFFSGGTLAIEKDEAANEIRFISPGGTLTMPLVDATNTQNNFDARDAGGLLFRGHGHHMHIPFGDVVANEATVKWHNARELKDGVQQFIIAMDTADPGTWGVDHTSQEIDSFYAGQAGGCGSGVLLCERSNVQQATRYQMQFTHVVADDTPTSRSVCNVFYRYRNFSAAGGSLDSCLIEDHGPIALAYVDPSNAENLLYKIATGDVSAIFSGTIYTAGSVTNSSPSIIWTRDRLRVYWYNGTNLLHSYSFDFGTTWSTPVALSITGTNPRVLVDPNHGLAWFFYHDGANIKVVGSGDYGAHVGTPVTVVAAVDAQTVAAALATDGRLVVVYVSAGTILEKKSQDLGQSWS